MLVKQTHKLPLFSSKDPSLVKSDMRNQPPGLLKLVKLCFCSSPSSVCIWKCLAPSQRCSFLLLQRPGTTGSDRRTDLRPSRGRPRLARPGRDQTATVHLCMRRYLLDPLAASLLDSWGVLTSDLASNKPKQGLASRRKEPDR